MPRQAAFLALMDSTELARFKAFAREPGRSVNQCHDWLQAECGMVDSKEFPEHARRVSRSAVHNWMQGFLEGDSIAAATDLADAIHTAAAEGGTVDLAGALNLQIAQRLQSLFIRASESGNSLDIDALLKAARAVNNIGQAQQRVTELKRLGVEQLAALKGEAKKRTITAEDIDRVSKAVFG